MNHIISEELRKEFEQQERLHWTNDQGEPEIEYVEWLEKRLGNAPLAPTTDQNAGQVDGVIDHAFPYLMGQVESCLKKLHVAMSSYQTDQWFKFDDLQKAVEALAATQPQPVHGVPSECGWSCDEWSETWSAGCGAEWVFPDGGPAENGMKFCPSCGKPVSLLNRQEGR